MLWRALRFPLLCLVLSGRLVDQLLFVAMADEVRLAEQLVGTPFANAAPAAKAALIMSQFTLEGVLLGVALPPAVETLLRKAAAHRHREANVGAQSRVNV